MDLTIRKEKQKSTLILYLKGVLDITTTSQINEYLEEIDDGLDALVFNLNELELMDSTGIGSILNAIYLSQQKKFKVEFQDVNKLTEELFETLGVYQILHAIQGEAV